MTTVKKVTLPNGLRILFVHMPESVATTVATLVAVGADYESKRENGLSHFLEHMCFKGTKTRPTAMEIASAFETLGAENNAFTGRQYTSYYAKVANEKAKEAFQLVADLYTDPLFDAKEMEKERGVIIEELNMYEDNPQRKVDRLFTELMYGDSAQGRAIGGTKETVSSFTSSDIAKYHARYYVPQNTVILVAGNFNQAEMEALVTSRFSSIASGVASMKEPFVSVQKAKRELLSFKESDQTHILLGFNAFSSHDPRRYALGILSGVLGGGMSSRLFQRVREQMGAAYYIYASEDLFTDYGHAYIGAGVNHEKAEDVISAICEECVRIRDLGITDEELVRTKNRITGRFLIGLETSDDVGYFYASRLLLGEEQEEPTPESVLEQLNAVTPLEVKQVAEEVIRNEGLSLTALGPFKKETFGDIVKV